MKQHKYTPLDSLITVPSQDISLKGFKAITAKNVEDIF